MYTRAHNAKTNASYQVTSYRNKRQKIFYEFLTKKFNFFCIFVKPKAIK